MLNGTTSGPPSAAPDPGDDRVDTSGPDRIVFVATLLVGVAFLASVFVRDESALDERDARIARIERRLSARDARDELAGYRDSERDAARMIQSLSIRETGPWRTRVERAPRTDDVPEPPPAPRADRIDGGATIELTWPAIEGIDGVRVYRRQREGDPMEQVTDRPVRGTRWTDELTELRGRYVYQLHAVRGEHESEASPPVEVAFRLPFDWEIVAVAPDGRSWADVVVTPRSDRIAQQRFRVGVGDDVHGFEIARIEATTETRRTTKTAPAFAPDGTRLRDADGRPVTQEVEDDVEIPITRVVAIPPDGGEPVTRRHRRR